CYISLDLIKQTVTLSRIEHSEFLSDEGARYRQAGVVEIPFLEHRGEPLFLEVEEFVSSVIEARPARVTGDDGVEVLRLAQWVADVALAS
ncbi:MAG: gfo/Idh/MocA family oxidoreductase, partial [Actinomycetota bacterium]|nr:gfo/Idh/MocA family oxidoreductase [Actinomycetota bacterium]